jgi:hypothetical protein
MCFYQFLSCFYHVSSMLLISSKNLFLIISSTWHRNPETDQPLPPSSKGQRRNKAMARVDLPEPVRPTTAKRSWGTTTVRLSQDFSWKADIPIYIALWGFVVGIHGKLKDFMKNGCWWILSMETYEPLWTMILYEIWQMLINVDKSGCKICKQLTSSWSWWTYGWTVHESTATGRRPAFRPSWKETEFRAKGRPGWYRKQTWAGHMVINPWDLRSNLMGIQICLRSSQKTAKDCTILYHIHNIHIHML